MGNPFRGGTIASHPLERSNAAISGARPHASPAFLKPVQVDMADQTLNVFQAQ